MTRIDGLVALIIASGAGVVVGTVLSVNVADNKRLEYLGKCLAGEQVWVNMRSREVKCGHLGNYWLPPSGIKGE